MRRRLGLALVALVVVQAQAALAGQDARKPLEVTITPPREAARVPEGVRRAAMRPTAAAPARGAKAAGVDPRPTGGIGHHAELRPGIVDIDVDGAGAVALAIAQSAGLRAVMAEEDAAAARLLRARLAFLPTITASLRLSDGPEDYNSPTNPTVVGTVSLGVALFDGGRRINRLRGARSELAGAVHEVEAARLQVAADTLGSVVELDYARRQAAILSETLRGLGATLSAVRSRRAAGLAGDGEVAEVEAELAELRRGIAAAEGAAARAGAGLRGQLGGEAAGTPGLPDLEGVVRRGPEWLAGKARGNPRVQAAWSKAIAADFSYKAVMGKYLPRLELGADYGAARNYGPLSDPNGLTVGLTLRVPLVEATTVAEVREARALAAAARYRAIDEANRFETQTRMEWAEYEAAGERMTLAARKAGALNRALAAKREQHRAGLIPVDDVLVLSRRVADARIQEAEARSTRYGAMVALGARAGTLIGEVEGRAPGDAAAGRPAEAASGLPGVRTAGRRWLFD